MRRIAVVLASLLTLTGAAVGGAVAAPPRKAGARAVPWRSTTSITWSGTKGVRLTSPTPLQLVGTRSGNREVLPYEVTLLRGTWAFVRIVAPDGMACTFEQRTGAHCAVWMVSKAKEIGHGAAGMVFWPGRNPLAAGTTEVYLFTDGAARLDLRASGAGAAPGTVRYEVIGKVTGAVRPLANQCLGTCGTDDFGGESRQLKTGFADVVLAHHAVAPAVPGCPQGDGCHVGFLNLGVCALTGPVAPPRGCPTPGATASWRDGSSLDLAVYDLFPDCTQSCYVGWRKTGPGTSTAWGTWYEYGIR